MTHKRLMFAINVPQMEKKIAEELSKRNGFDCEVVASLTHLDGITDACKRLMPNVLIISTTLPQRPRDDFLRIMRDLKSEHRDLQIIVMTEKREPGDPLLSGLCMTNIFDFFATDRCSYIDIVNLIVTPHQFQDVVKYVPNMSLDQNKDQLAFHAGQSLDDGEEHNSNRKEICSTKNVIRNRVVNHVTDLDPIQVKKEKENIRADAFVETGTQLPANALFSFTEMEDLAEDEQEHQSVRADNKVSFSSDQGVSQESKNQVSMPAHVEKQKNLEQSTNSIPLDTSAKTKEISDKKKVPRSELVTPSVQSSEMENNIEQLKNAKRTMEQPPERPIVQKFDTGNNKTNIAYLHGMQIQQGNIREPSKNDDAQKMNNRSISVRPFGNTADIPEKDHDHSFVKKTEDIQKKEQELKERSTAVISSQKEQDIVQQTRITQDVTRKKNDVKDRQRTTATTLSHNTEMADERKKTEKMIVERSTDSKESKQGYENPNQHLGVVSQNIKEEKKSHMQDQNNNGNQKNLRKGNLWRLIPDRELGTINECLKGALYGVFGKNVDVNDLNMLISLSRDIDEEISRRANYR